MSGKHRKIGSRTKKIATVGVATATVTAMTVGAAPPPPKPKPAPLVVNKDVDLAAAFRPFTDPDQIPDLTGGLGTVGYNLSQSVADALLRLIVENVNLGALARAAGLDLESVLEQLPAELLDGVLGAIPINITGVLGDTLTGVLGPITSGLLTPLLIQALTALGITDSAGNTTLVDLLGLLGLDLSDPLNLANLDIPGVKLITTGPPFTLLKLLGADLGWVPGLPNSVASAINNTSYLDVGLKGLLNTVLDKLDDAGDPLGLLNLLTPIVNGLPIDVDLAQVRVPITVGFGLGAFAAGAAYDKVVADLVNQPGGPNYTGTPPVLGSFTVLPLVLLRNPGRANGGLFARFFPLAGLFGIDTVTPETEVTSRGGIPLLNTGLSLGGANLVPIKIDGTVQYDIMSDFAAWPNPFSIANSVVGAALPTYLLRGIDTSNLTPQLVEQIEAALQRATNLNEPLALNLYLTLATNSLPMLEPLYLTADALNLVSFGTLGIPFQRIANAFAPALTSLTNLGYTDVVRNPDGTYTRTLDEAGVPTPFMSFPDVNWGQVPGDVINSLIKGIQKEFFSGNPTPGTPNAITGLLKLLSGVLDPLGGLGGILNGLNLTQLVTEQISPLAANALPAADSKMVTLSTDPEGDVSTGKHAAPVDAPVPDDTGAEPKHATEEAEMPTEEAVSETTEPDSSEEDEQSGTTTPKPTTSPKPAAPRNPVGDVVGGAASVVANGVAGVLKGLAPKKPASSTTKTSTTKTSTTTTKIDADKDTTNGGSSETAKKDAA
jgi:hypothetical protein